MAPMLEAVGRTLRRQGDVVTLRGILIWSFGDDSGRFDWCAHHPEGIVEGVNSTDVRGTWQSRTES